MKSDANDLARNIESRYKSHTKEAASLKGSREFKYFKFNTHRLTVYMYNP